MLELLHEQVARLSKMLEEEPEGPWHSVGFCTWLLTSLRPSGPHLGSELTLEKGAEIVNYEGYPGLAYLGYLMSANVVDAARYGCLFANGLTRLRQRTGKIQSEFGSDDVALLGVAQGLRCMRGTGGNCLADAESWLVGRIDCNERGRGSQWTARLRSLAGDLLDDRGRVRIAPRLENIDAIALELVLRRLWPSQFTSSPLVNIASPADTLRRLLESPLPTEGDIERASVRLLALDAAMEQSCAVVVPTVSDTARLLLRVQHALKRWRWEAGQRRGRRAASQWLIDDEYDVQSLLWAVLYPIYGSDLVDETYLANWGFVQPRADLAVLSLKLIIEVKIARSPADAKKIEEQVAGDLGLYFKEPDHFESMIVFVYDDSDESWTEKYDGLRNALKKRDRIEDVVVIRRPSVIPNRAARGIQESDAP